MIPEAWFLETVRATRAQLPAEAAEAILREAGDRTAAYVALPTSMILAATHMMYGHDQPGDGFTAGVIISLAVPALPVQPALLYIVLAEAIAVIIGVLAGVLPARRAAHLDPVEALRVE